MTTFRGTPVPEQGSLAGYAWLIERYQLALPAPPVLTAIAGRHRPRDAGSWRLLPE